MEAGQILITGANRGLGLELVRQFSSDGWDVLACCRAPESAAELSRLAAQSSGRVRVIPLDVSRAESIQRLAQNLRGEPIDILFSNAGVYGGSGQAGLGSSVDDSDEWMQVFAVNTIAPLQLVDTLMPNLLLGKQKIIALMSSKMASLADNSSGGSYIYRSSKVALNAVGKSLAVDLAPEGIKVALLHPGWVQTDMGGPNGLIQAKESVLGMRDVLNTLTPEKSGKFFNYDGSELPW